GEFLCRSLSLYSLCVFFFQAEDGIRDYKVTGVQTCALPIFRWVGSDDCESASGAASVLEDVHGVLIPGGFGIRGIEGKIGAISRSEERRVGKEGRARWTPEP